MRPHSVRGWWPVPSPCSPGSRATYCTGSSSAPSTRSCVVGSASSTCSSDGPAYQAACSGCVMLSPRSADTGTMAATAMPASAAKACSALAHRLEGRLRIGQRIDLVDREHDARHAQQVGQQCMAARLRQQRHRRGGCQSILVMSTSTTAASLPAAAVTMLRVYCSWPGASAMMNLRCGVAK